MHVYKLTVVALYQKCQNYIFYSSGNSACDANILIGFFYKKLKNANDNSQ